MDIEHTGARRDRGSLGCTGLSGYIHTAGEAKQYVLGGFLFFKPCSHNMLIHHPSNYTFICSFIHLSFHLFIHLFINSFACSFIHLIIQPFINWSFIHLSYHPYIHSSIYFFYVFIHSSVHP